MSNTLIVKAPRGQVGAVVRQFVQTLAGKGTLGQDMARGIQLRMGMTLLSLVQQSFITKARGGSDETGRWEPLKKSTVAARRLGPGDPKAKNSGPRPYLTPNLDKEWRKIFATRKAWLIAKHGMSEAAASAQAAKIAWSAVKGMGGQTKLELLGNRPHEIGRDTGALLASLTPGVNHPEQVLRAELGAVVVGSRLRYAAHFHKRRPLWPQGSPVQLPASWNAALVGAARRGIMEAVTQMVAGR